MANKIVLIPEELQEEYILIKCDEFDKKRRGFREGERLFRISEWMSGNGCGVRQALFRKPNSSPTCNDICVWEDYVKPVSGQVDLFDII